MKNIPKRIDLSQKHLMQSHITSNSLIRIICSYKREWQLFLMFTPVIICLAMFSYAPMYGLIIAFKDYRILDGIWGSKWVGLKHFQTLITAPSFKEVFLNTVKISFLRILFGFPAPIILSLLLNEVKVVWYKKIVQTVSYLPHFLSWVVLSGILINFLSPTTGFINQLLVMMGGKAIYFVADTKYFVPMLIVTGIWQGVGWGTIIYLAAISNINPELYEAAIVDGANRFKRVIHITLPSIAPIVSVMFILNSGNLINAGFDQIFNMYNEAVYRVADIIDTYVYRRGIEQAQYSFSTAVGLFKNIISFSLVIFTNIVTKKINSEGGIW